MKMLLLICLSIASITSSFAQNFDNLKYILGRSIEYRNQITDIYPRLEALNKKDYVLIEKDISYLNQHSIERSRFESAVFAYLEDLEYTVNRRLKKKYIPTATQLNDTMAYLSVSLTMYDSFLATYLKINKLKKIRRFLNSADKAIGKERNLFKKNINYYTSFKFRKRMRRGINIFKKFYQEDAKAQTDIELASMAAVIQESFTYQRLVKQKFWANAKDFFSILNRKINIGHKANIDFINRAGKKTLYTISKLIGNAMGSVQFRNGLLYNDPDFLNQVLNYSKPLDIILEKTPFRLTDRSIPGYWGHAAIYIGNEIQLRELDIWDHPLVEKYQEKIKMGKSIVEALRSGVELNSYKHFTDIDDFALLRRKDIWEQEDAGEHIIRALSQVGKTYDFEFDVETPTSIVCSELHYTVYRDLTFRTSTILGRNTISVDQVSYQAYSGAQFQPQILYINGVEIVTNVQSAYDSILDHPKSTDKWMIDDKEEFMQKAFGKNH